MAPFRCLSVMELNPTKQYTLQVLCKNETGWGDPSEKFKIHILQNHLCLQNFVYPAKGRIL